MQNGGNARVVLYERRSHAVVIGGPSGRGWISRALGVGGLDVRDGHLQAPHPSAGT